MFSINSEVSLFNGATPKRFAIFSWVCTSLNDPLAMYKKRIKSASLPLAAPYAILLGTDTAAPRSWLIKPNLSSLG